MSHTLAQSQRQPHQPRCHRHSPAPRLSAVVLMLAALWLLAACGEDSKHFKLEGRMLQMNSGEFYVYSDDGDIDGFDTIKVQGGRFAYEIPCEHPFTFTVVFPNYSQLPIFAEPGKTVEVDGDASHLKALKIKGSKTNELMSAFREHVANASPPETKQFAAQFIKDHVDSPVSLYLLKRYFVATPMPDYQQAAQLVSIIRAKQPENAKASRLEQQIRMMQQTSAGQRLPNFAPMTDINGNTITPATLSKGVAVILVWAVWDYNSTDMLRQLRNQQTNLHKDFKVVAISVDASKKDVKNFLQMNPVPWNIVCTGEMFEMRQLHQLGLLVTPGNIVVKDGRIVARDLSMIDLSSKIASL